MIMVITPRHFAAVAAPALSAAAAVIFFLLFLYAVAFSVSRHLGFSLFSSHAAYALPPYASFMLDCHCHY